MATVIYEHEEGQVLPDDAIDGMALMLAEDASNGFEGVNVWDISLEDPPHKFLRDSPNTLCPL